MKRLVLGALGALLISGCGTPKAVVITQPSTIVIKTECTRDGLTQEQREDMWYGDEISELRAKIKQLEASNEIIFKQRNDEIKANNYALNPTQKKLKDSWYTEKFNEIHNECFDKNMDWKNKKETSEQVIDCIMETEAAEGLI